MCSSLCTESVCQSDLNPLCELGSAAGGCQMKYEGVRVTFRGQEGPAPAVPGVRASYPCWEAFEVSFSFLFPKAFVLYI